MSRSLHRIARIWGLAFLLVLPALAQDNPSPTQSLKSPLGDIRSAPLPRDSNGDQIQPKAPTTAEREVERREKEERAKDLAAADERKAAKARSSADERQTTEHLAEEQRFHGRILVALYVGVAIVAVGIASRLIKRS